MERADQLRLRREHHVKTLAHGVMTECLSQMTLACAAESDDEDADLLGQILNQAAIQIQQDSCAFVGSSQDPVGLVPSPQPLGLRPRPRARRGAAAGDEKTSPAPPPERLTPCRSRRIQPPSQFAYFDPFSHLRFGSIYPILNTVRNATFNTLQVAPLRRSSPAP